MQVQPLIIAVIAGVAVWGLIEVWMRWRASRIASRALDRALHPERYASEPRAPLSQRVVSLCVCPTQRLFVSDQTARSSELAGLTYRRSRSSRPVMDQLHLMCSGFCTGLTAVAPFPRAPLATVSCLSDFRLCQASDNKALD